MQRESTDAYGQNDREKQRPGGKPVSVFHQVFIVIISANARRTRQDTPDGNKIFLEQSILKDDRPTAVIFSRTPRLFPEGYRVRDAATEEWEPELLRWLSGCPAD